MLTGPTWTRSTPIRSFEKKAPSEGKFVPPFNRRNPAAPRSTPTHPFVSPVISPRAIRTQRTWLLERCFPPSPPFCANRSPRCEITETVKGGQKVRQKEESQTSPQLRPQLPPYDSPTPPEKLRQPVSRHQPRSSSRRGSSDLLSPSHDGKAAGMGVVWLVIRPFRAD